MRDRGKEEEREGGRLNVITTEGHPIGTYGANTIRFPRACWESTSRERVSSDCSALTIH